MKNIAARTVPAFFQSSRRDALAAVVETVKVAEDDEPLVTVVCDGLRLHAGASSAVP